MGFIDNMIGQELRDFINQGSLGDVFKFNVSKFLFGGGEPEKEQAKMSFLNEQQREAFQQIEVYKLYVNKYIIGKNEQKMKKQLLTFYDTLLKYPISVGGRGRKDAVAALTGVTEPEKRGFLEGFMNRPQNVEVVTSK